MKNKTTARKRIDFHKLGKQLENAVVRPIDDKFYKRQTKARLIEIIELKEKVETDLIKQVKTLTWAKDCKHIEIKRLLKNQLIGTDKAYGRGFYNGLELAVAVIEERAPSYLEAAPTPIVDKVEVVHKRIPDLKENLNAGCATAPTRHLGHIDPEKMTPEELVNFFMNVMDGHEMKLPAVLDGMNERILDKLRREAEAHGERAAVARKRFEEAHQGVLRSAKG